MVIRSRKLRPSRSSFHTMSVSPLWSFFKQRSRAGRLVVAPEIPSSLNRVLHPAFFEGHELQGWILVVGDDARIAEFHALVLH